MDNEQMNMNSEESDMIGYDPSIYEIEGNALIACKSKTIDAKNKIPSIVERIEKHAFDRVTISGTFVIPKTVNLIVSNAFNETVFDELVFETRETELKVKIDAFQKITIHSNELFIPENVTLMSFAIELNNSVIVRFESLLDNCCEKAESSFSYSPLVHTNKYGANTLYVIKDDISIDSKLFLRLKGYTGSSQTLYYSMRSNQLVGSNWFHRTFVQYKSYSHYVNKDIKEIARAVNWFIEDCVEFVKSNLLPILNEVLTDAACYRFIRELFVYEHHNESKSLLQQVLFVLDRFTEERDFSEEYFEVENGILVDYVAKAKKEQRLYIKIPEGITTIREETFFRGGFLFDSENEGIRYLYLPESLEYLEPRCLIGLSLKAVYCHHTYEEVDFVRQYIDSFYKGTGDDYPVRVINVDALSFTDVSNDDLVIEEDVLKKCATDSCGIVYIPEGIQKVEAKAFENCTYITEIHFPKTVTYIGHHCFDGCGLLSKLVFDDHARFIMEPTAWSAAPKLIEDHKDENVIILGETLVVYRDKDEKEYTVPANVHFINNGAFAGRDMKHISFSGDIEYIGDHALAYNENLTKMYLPHGLQKTGSKILNYCHLYTLIFPEGFFFKEEDFRSMIGDPKIGVEFFHDIYLPGQLDVYVDDKYCEEEHSFEYYWDEGPYFDRKFYKVTVVYHPRSKISNE